jgi:hypothetical protein
MRPVALDERITTSARPSKSLRRSATQWCLRASPVKVNYRIGRRVWSCLVANTVEVIPMKRRTFLKSSLAMGLSAGVSNSFSQAYDTAAWAITWDSALVALASNVKIMPKFDRPILHEGSVYRGAWMECGPHESLAYAELANFVALAEGRLSPLEIAINTHRAFFANQRETTTISVILAY